MVPTRPVRDFYYPPRFVSRMDRQCKYSVVSEKRWLPSQEYTNFCDKSACWATLIAFFVRGAGILCFGIDVFSYPWFFSHSTLIRISSDDSVCCATSACWWNAFQESLLHQHSQVIECSPFTTNPLSIIDVVKGMADDLVRIEENMTLAPSYLKATFVWRFRFYSALLLCV